MRYNKTDFVLLLCLLPATLVVQAGSHCALTRFLLLDTHPLTIGQNSTIIGELLPNQASELCLPTDARIQIQVIANSCANVILKLQPGASNGVFCDYKFEYEFPYKLYHIPDGVDDVGRSVSLGVNYTIRATPEFRRKKAITANFRFNATCDGGRVWRRLRRRKAL